jgi:hypothetical protein
VHARFVGIGGWHCEWFGYNLLDISRYLAAHTVTRHLSQVWVNQYNILHNNVPFGGKKQSGIGMQFGPFVPPMFRFD